MFDKIRVSSLAVTLGVALLAAAAVPQLRASEFDKKTIMTFSAPVEISGHALPAGTYVFKTLENNRNVVMVMNSEENRVYALLQTIPIETSAVTLGVALLAAAAVPQLRASEFDKKTIMTFSAPVEISGHALK